MPQKDLAIRSEAVQEILTRIPNWIVRWGITLILGLIVLLIAMAWLIKYPDVIQGPTTLTTQRPPVKLVTQASGAIRQLYVADNTWIQAASPIAEIANPVSEQAITYLRDFLLKVQKGLAEGLDAQAHLAATNYVFGDIQAEYNRLKLLIQDYMALVQGDHYPCRIKELKSQLANYQRLAGIIEQQGLYMQQVLANEAEKYKAYQQLYEQGGVAKMDFLTQEAQYFKLQQDIAAQRKTAVQNEVTISEYEQRVRELTFEYHEKRRTLQDAIHAAIHNIQNAIQQWQQSYILCAPFAGKLSYLERLSENQFVETGQELFAIIPDNEAYIAYARVPLQGYGKIKVGQRARIKLAPYPSHGYGYLSATVKDMALIAHQAHYLVTLQLAQGMKSTYGKELPFKPAMEGMAEIITEDTRLLQRILNRFLDLTTP